MWDSKDELCAEHLCEDAPGHLEEGVADEEGGEDPADLGASPAQAICVLHPTPGVRAIIGIRAGTPGAVIRPWLGESQHWSLFQIQMDYLMGFNPRPKSPKVYLNWGVLFNSRLCHVMTSPPWHGDNGDAHVDPEHVVGHEPREDEEA